MGLYTPKFNIDVPTMIFVDGGYLKKQLEKQKIDIKKYDLEKFSVKIAERTGWGNRRHIIIRTYFYDGIGSPSESEYPTQKKFHDSINENFSNYEVRQGRVVRSGNGDLRQKGVDTLLAIDMIDKANSNQYEIAIVVAGDLDHLEAIKTTKNKGKKVYGFFNKESSSKELTLEFDRRYILEEFGPEFILNWNNLNPMSSTVQGGIFSSEELSASQHIFITFDFEFDGGTLDLIQINSS